MCKVLMSIKPKYAMQILNGTKTFEYRKNRFRRQNIDSIVIYATSPVMKEDEPEIIWEKTYHNGGINKEAYDEYFAGKEKAIAYILGKVKKYDNEKRLSDFHINVPPQSYFYLD